MRESELTFEGTIKGWFRFIADLSRDLCDATARGCEQLGAELKPPACEVGHGGLRKVTSETLGQYGTGNPYLIRKRGNRPRMCGFAMEHGQGFPDLLIADA